MSEERRPFGKKIYSVFWIRTDAPLLEKILVSFGIVSKKNYIVFF